MHLLGVNKVQICPFKGSDAAAVLLQVRFVHFLVNNDLNFGLFLT